MNKDPKNHRFSFHELFQEEGKSCPHQDQLFQYFQNLLGEEEQQKFEGHLKSCSLCASQLVEIQETATATTSLVLDSSVAEKILEQNRKKFENFLDDAFEDEVLKDSTRTSGRFFKVFSFPGYANALVIALLVVLLYPAYQGFVLKDDVERLRNELDGEKSKARVAPEDVSLLKESYEKQIQSLKEERSAPIEPTLSPAGVYAVREERAGQLETISLNFDDKQKNYNLVFSVPAIGSTSSRVEILEDGKSIWKDEVTPLASADSTSGLISVSLPSEYLKGNTYRLVIFSVEGDNARALAEYKLKVSHGQ